MAGEEDHNEIPPEKDLAKEITVPPLPSHIISAKAAVDEKKSEDAVDTLVAIDKHEENVQVRNLREKFSIVVAVFVFLWMVGIYALLIFQGIRRLQIWPQHWLPFDLSEKVLLAALGTVTLNIVGLLTVVIKFVFPEKKPNS